MSREYPSSVVDQAIDRVKQIPRQIALQPALKTDLEDRPIVVIPYHPHNQPIKRFILDTFSRLQRDPVIGNSFPSMPLVAHKRLPNLKDSLVRSRFRSNTSTILAPGSHPCNKTNCKACPFLSRDLTIRRNGKSFTIKRRFHCQMSNIVYLISCEICDALYVGETGRPLEVRFSEHLANIRHERDSTLVAKHFFSAGHSINNIRVRGLWMVHGDIVDRKNVESWFINRFSTKHPLGLNLRS